MRYLLACDLDNTLTGDKVGIKKFNKIIGSNEFYTIISSGRFKQSIISHIKEAGLSLPDAIVANLGTEIYYGPEWKKDKKWEKIVANDWDKKKIEEDLNRFKLNHQPYEKTFVVSFFCKDNSIAEEIMKRVDAFNAKAVHTESVFLDIIPKVGGKGNAAKYLGSKLSLPLISCGDSENDEEMLKKSDYGILVGNAQNHLKQKMMKHSHIYIAKNSYSIGVIEGLIHYKIISQNSC